jgi:hypothetical protein
MGHLQIVRAQQQIGVTGVDASRCWQCGFLKLAGGRRTTADSSATNGKACYWR